MAATKKCRLNAGERDFFTLVSQVVFTNPFTDARQVLDVKITGLSPQVPEARRIERLIAVVGAKIDVLEKRGCARIDSFTGSDRLLVETSFLFDFFHRFLDRFDRFIQDQIAAGSRPLKVPFAREAFGYLDRRGFNPMEVRRYFELVFQLRRAYFFINSSLVGRSACMQTLRRKLWNNVFTHNLHLYNLHLWDRMEDFSTLILGETGTGKGTAAAAIGRSGFIPYDDERGRFVESFTRSFVPLNLSQFPENLIESELFGHRKGAFTGAVENYEGIFDRCSPHGAIFLDEIGEVPIPVQIKLLQVLQEREFSPVGSHETHRFQGRVIAATNRSMEVLRREKMRDDFYYRLCSDIIIVPPLRRRIREDVAEQNELIALLVQRMLGRHLPDVIEMVHGAIACQPGKAYAWPGNVRELEQCVRSVLLNRRYRPEPVNTALDLPAHLMERMRAGNLAAQQLVAGYCRLLHQQHGTYEAVARRTKLDRRTVKKYVQQWGQTCGNPQKSTTASS